ncbi:MAG: hypothetical protein K8T25_18000 [Planctomycetia bacterium]|nr:hypothetical protein [Planctomycetia bacterium]
MRHPFDGIIIPEERAAEDTGLPSPLRRGFLALSGIPRRTMLGWFGAVVAAPWLIGGRLFAAPKKDEKDSDNAAATSTRALYYIIPKDKKKLPAATQKKLELDGGYVTGWAARQQYEKTPGYWAWIDDATADKARQDGDVETVEKMTAADIKITGQPRPQGPQQMMIELAPNSWRTKPKHGTFQSANDVARQWAKDFAKENFQFRPTGNASILVVMPLPTTDAVIDRLKENPQVVALHWAGADWKTSTQALGEEGGAVTNRAGEQGGGASTRRVGEEGGQPSTRAAGEEGGATTYALGEEGAGRVSTNAIGEEGGAGAGQ